MSETIWSKTLIEEDIAKIANKEVARVMGHKTQTNGGEIDTKFEQIEETQLLSYLRAGWQIVKELQNGEIIVKR